MLNLNHVFLPFKSPKLNHSSSFTNLSAAAAAMGMVFGKIRVATPKFEVLHSTDDYEIRQYSSTVVAEITYDPAEFKGDKDGGFSILANYIGVFSTPQNTKPEQIDMTTPVITKAEKIDMTTPVLTKAEKIDMTTPVVTKGNEGSRITMQFTLPDKYKKAEEAPKPIDPRVVIKDEGEKKYAVVGFSGVATQTVVTDKVDKLKKDLEKDGVKVAGDHVLARYNPPWTLPPFRKNEVMIPVE